MTPYGASSAPPKDSISKRRRDEIDAIRRIDPLENVVFVFVTGRASGLTERAALGEEA